MRKEFQARRPDDFASELSRSKGGFVHSIMKGSQCCNGDPEIFLTPRDDSPSRAEITWCRSLQKLPEISPKERGGSDCTDIVNPPVSSSVWVVNSRPNRSGRACDVPKVVANDCLSP